MSAFTWTVIDFGKFEGKGMTLPQIVFTDPDWFFHMSPAKARNTGRSGTTTRVKGLPLAQPRQSAEARPTTARARDVAPAAPASWHVAAAQAARAPRRAMLRVLPTFHPATSLGLIAFRLWQWRRRRQR